MKRQMLSLVLLLQAIPTLCQPRQTSLQVNPDGTGALVIIVKSGYPLRDTLNYLNENYGWLVSYEDPAYPDSEIEDIAIPQWKKAHPGEPGFLTPIFTQVRFRITKPSGREGEQQLILNELVDQFNRLGRQEKFTVIEEPQHRAVIVGSVNGRNILEAATVGPSIRERNAGEEMRLLIEGCSLRTAFPLIAGTVIGNRNSVFPPRKTNVSCRDALLAVTAKEGPNLVYQILEDVNTKSYVVSVIPGKVLIQPQ